MVLVVVVGGWTRSGPGHAFGLRFNLHLNCNWTTIQNTEMITLTEGIEEILQTLASSFEHVTKKQLS